MNRPVLILGHIPRIVLPVAHSLHKNNVPVDVASFTSASRIRSRSVQKFKRLPHPDGASSEFKAQLQAFIQERGHDMLIPADDQALTAVMNQYDDFKDMLHIACPPPAITNLVLNKESTLEIAQECGIRVPKTQVVTNSERLLELASSFRFPWVLKPAAKETSAEDTKSYNFANADEVARKFPTALKFSPPMLLQERCEGAGVGVEMLIHDGECLAVFQHRRLKELPYTGGCAITAVAEQPSPELVKLSFDLLRALRWEGVAMVEFKVNDGGQAVFMEVNGRYWGSISLAIMAGVDFPYYHWQLVHQERPCVPGSFAVGTRWRWTAGYIHRLYLLLDACRSSSAARKALAGEVLNFAEDFGPSISDPTLALSDPLPAIAAMVHTIKDSIILDIFGTLRRGWERLGRKG